MNIGAFPVNEDSRHRHLPISQQYYLRNQDFEEQYADEYLSSANHLPHMPARTGFEQPRITAAISEPGALILPSVPGSTPNL